MQNGTLRKRHKASLKRIKEEIEKKPKENLLRRSSIDHPRPRAPHTSVCKPYQTAELWDCDRSQSEAIIVPVQTVNHTSSANDST